MQMPRFGAITYTRARAEAGWFEFSENERADWMSPSRSKLADVKAHLVEHPRLSLDVSKSSSGKSGQIVRELVDWLIEACQDLSFISVAGYGPIIEDNPNKPNYGLIHERAAAPFNGVSVLSLVRAAFEERTKSVPPLSLINDCTAVGLYDLWDRPGVANGHAEIVGVLIVGRGIGGAVVRPNRNGLASTSLSEIGHIPVHHLDADIHLDGPTCDFHRGCLTSHASWRAVTVRAKKSGMTLRELIATSDHPIWELEADYLAQACLTLILTNTPTRIVLGGSLIDQTSQFLLPLIRARLTKMVGDFLPRTNPQESPDFLQTVDRDSVLLQGALLNAVTKWQWTPIRVK